MASQSASSGSDVLSIKFRLAPGLHSASNNSDITLQVPNPATETVAELKTRLAEKLSNVTHEQIRLVYAGRVFKDDDATVASLNVQNGAVVHATKLAVSRTAEEAAGAGSPSAGGLPALGAAAGRGSGRNAFGLPAEMSGLLDNPFVRNIMSNPEFIRQMIENDPRIARLAESNPQLRQTLNDPRFLTEMMETMRNPALSQEMMRNVDRQLLNIENIPGGFNALSSMYNDIQAPLGASEENPSTDEANRRYAEMLGAQQRSNSNSVNDQALPNPWAPPPSRPAASSTAHSPFGGLDAAMAGMGGLGGYGGGSNMGASSLFNPAAFMQPSSQSPTSANTASRSSTQPSPSAFDVNTLMQQMQQMQSMFGGGDGGFGSSPFGGGAGGGLGDGMGGLFGPGFASPTVTSNASIGAGQATTPVQSTAQHEERFAEQLSTLNEMGFSEKDKSIRALLAAGGNVEAAIAYLLEH
ncbi:hypothetical protein DFS34DRAFT_263593 [Phlyctochytrium arcticum]|nr:hypothetical protein DFS34DRAFT_263593 [Phlyctochytrium arcticum]